MLRLGRSHVKRTLRPHILASLRQQNRGFFGLGEVLGVIANPAETIRQMKESKDLLSQAQEEMAINKEAKKIPKKHTFSRLPGFHGRETEISMLKKVLSSHTPTMNVIFGATSVGKTALLRQVLATEDFFVIRFDLRISGFADLRSLYFALCEQFELFFKEMNNEEMSKNSLTFKHLALELAEKNKDKEHEYVVSVADIANLMECLQSSLLAYWEYDPKSEVKDEGKKEKPKKEPQMRLIDPTIERDESEDEVTKDQKENEVEEAPLFKKKPLVFFIDEAHKLPALINDRLALKVLLDTLLVLTKQDRLCNVVLCTSDSFFQHFLRTMNVGHHVQLMTIGDCSKEATRKYFMDELVEQVPERLRSRLNFEEVYHAFGGKLSHISDYVQAWINSDGGLTPYTSAIFVQSYALLQFHLTRGNFKTFSPLTSAVHHGSEEGEEDAQFTEEQLLQVMRILVKAPHSIPYFDLCRAIGTGEVDAMIRTRILDLRWTKTISPEDHWLEREWSRDGVERPILLPMTRILRRAMEIVLESIPATEAQPAKEDIVAEGLYSKRPHSVWREDVFRSQGAS